MECMLDYEIFFRVFCDWNSGRWVMPTYEALKSLGSRDSKERDNGWLLFHATFSDIWANGTTISSWVGGGGGLALLFGTDYLFSSQARPENLFPGKLKTEYLFSTATNFRKSKKKKKRGGGGGGVSERV